MSDKIDAADIHKGYMNHPIMTYEDVVRNMGEYATEIVVKLAEWTAFNESLKLPEDKGLEISDFFMYYDSLAIAFLNGLLQELTKSKEMIYDFLDKNPNHNVFSRANFATWMRINTKIARENIDRAIDDFEKRDK